MLITSSFFNVISESEWAFDLLYCVAFMVMDKQWLERNATYMEFNVRILDLYMYHKGLLLITRKLLGSNGFG